jgi:hypothetical protein
MANSKTDSLLQVLNIPVHDTIKVYLYIDLTVILSKSSPDSSTGFAQK